MSIFLTMLLIASVPVLAGNSDGNAGGNQGVGNAGANQVKAVDTNIVNDNIGNQGKGNQGSGEVMRTQVKKQVQNKIMTASQYKERAQIRENAMAQERPEFDALKERARECKSNNEEECVQVRTQLRSKAKQNLIWSAEKAEDILAQTKEKISSLKISEEEKTALTEKITEKINSIAEERTTLEGDESEISTDKIKNSVATMRHAWNDIKKETNMNMHRHALNKFDDLFNKLSKTPEALKAQLEKLNEDGTEIDDSLTEAFFEIKEQAEAAYNEAKDDLEKAEQSTTEESSELMKMSREKMKETQRLLVQAREELRNTIKEMTSFKKDETSEE